MVSWLLLSVWLMGSLPTEPVAVHLRSDRVDDFTGWQLICDTDADFQFNRDGSLQLVIPERSAAFEVVDGARQTMFVGAWSTYGAGESIVIFVDGRGLNVHQVVSAGRTAQSTWDVAGEVSVIQPKDHPERVTAQTSDWLKEEAEVLLQKTNLGGGSPILRGMSGNRVLLMVDGFRLNNATFRLGLNQYLNSIPGANLEQFEVLGGPSGVQYGSDGLGGTVHLRTNDPAEQKGDALHYHGQISSADESTTHRLHGHAAFGNLAFAGHFSLNQYEDLEAPDPIGAQVPTGYDAWDGSLNITYKLNENQRVRIINSVSRGDNVPRTDRVISGRDLLWEYHPQEFRLHGVRFESSTPSLLMDHLDIGLGLMQQDEGRRRISSRSPDELELEQDRTETLQFNGSFTKVGQRSQWVYGFDFADDGVESAGLLTDLTTDTTVVAGSKFPDGSAFQTLGLFVTNESNLFGNHWLRLGLRHTWVELEGSLAEPIGNVRQKNSELTPTATWAMRNDRYVLNLGVSQGFRAPSLEDSLALGASNQGFDAPNPDLEPERLWNYELNLRFRLARATVEAGVYHARYEDLMDKVPGTWQGRDTYNGEQVFVIDNVGEAEVNGASLQIQGQVGLRHGWRADAAWTKGTNTENDEPMRRIPPLRGNLSWRYRAGQWNLSGVFSWADRQDRLSSGDISDNRIPEGGTPGYGVFHLRGNYRFNEFLDVKAGFENLTDKLYKSHGSGVYEPGRRLMLGLQASWR
ncbi:TonB-dependent receptor [Acanthopleuribacter pedis]|uniref:TonB-dependent receptor n=1 Tax=Acanthopleuribacter pedis TaxID=442870 RepID=A0A8J7U6B5_9BACT|nr:TonB-dependent receptor [Acanthopleuribacter pedis]MBO1321283.1 TonB-dependent receptor [Acanthopleuribacter pedis]